MALSYQLCFHPSSEGFLFLLIINPDISFNFLRYLGTNIHQQNSGVLQYCPYGTNLIMMVFISNWFVQKSYRGTLCKVPHTSVILSCSKTQRKVNMQ